LTLPTSWLSIAVLSFAVFDNLCSHPSFDTRTPEEQIKTAHDYHVSQRISSCVRFRLAPCAQPQDYTNRSTTLRTCGSAHLDYEDIVTSSDVEHRCGNTKLKPNPNHERDARGDRVTWLVVGDIPPKWQPFKTSWNEQNKTKQSKQVSHN
jgi:hypothetical protein